MTGRGREQSDVARRVGAVVVNHDAGDALLACTASLRCAGIEHLVVVDNASSDGSLERLADADTAAALLPTGQNLGYGTTVNRGAMRLQTPYLLVCNPDVVVDEPAVAMLAARLDERLDLAVVGPRLVSPDGVPYPSARAFPSFVMAAGHALLGWFHPDNRWTRRYRLAEHSTLEEGLRDEGDVDWVSGACLLVRREAFRSVGGFDERYFMYVEDLDLCWRLHRAGWGVRFVPQARVVHEHGHSTRRQPLRMLVAHHRSTWQFAVVRSTGAARLTLPFVAAGLLVRLIASGARELLA